MSKTPKILSLLTLFLLLLAIFQGSLHFLPIKELKGAYLSAERPQWSHKEWMNGAYQAAADRYVKEHHGLREWSIRLYNQYLWSAYHLTNNSGSVTVGAHNYLFEPYFVDEYYTGCSQHFASDTSAMSRTMELTAQRLAKVQAILEEQGVHLFVACLPGKERTYPQYLPQRDEVDQQQRLQSLRAIDRYPQLFNLYNVRHINVCRWFDSLNGHTPYLLFTQTGTHWSNIASTYAFDSIMHFMQTFGPPITPVTLSAPYTAPRRDPDADLDELLNKIFYIPTVKNQYVDVALSADTVAHPPSLVVIGDSFFWNIIYNYPLQSLFSHFRYWYYFNSIYYDPDHQNISEIDLVDQLLSADYVMLSYCTVQLYQLGNGFVDRALLQLCYDPDEIQAVRDSLASDTSSTLSVDQRLCLHLEDYFPDLQPDHPTRRCSRLAHRPDGE